MKYFLLLLGLGFALPSLAMTDMADHSHHDTTMIKPMMPSSTGEAMEHSSRQHTSGSMQPHKMTKEVLPLHQAEPGHHSDNPAIEAYAHIHHTMHEAMNIEFTGDADIDFLRGMIPHHQGAIDMAQVQKQHGQDGTVKFFTNKVVRDQTKEIRWMKGLLATLEHERKDKMMVNEDAITFNKKVNHHMHKAMAIEYTGNADIDFMRGMIPHHQGAIDMAQVVLMYGTDSRVQNLARSIINAQTTEITAMKKWLSRLQWRSSRWRFGAW